MEVGAKELIFIERSGLLFGFLFGCLQTCLWYFYQESWVLPTGGLVVRSTCLSFLSDVCALFLVYHGTSHTFRCIRWAFLGF